MRFVAGFDPCARSAAGLRRVPLVSLPQVTTAFALGGGGLLGAHEVGMLRALAEAGIRPDLVVGTSIGAVLLPPVEIDGAHYFDGGLVDSIPVGRAVALGASTVYVLQVGRIESPLPCPSGPGRSASSRSRSRGGTGFTRRCPRCRLASGCACCPLAASGSPRSASVPLQRQESGK